MSHCFLAFVVGLTLEQNFGPVIGVSKRCCPVCAHLLNLLSTSHHDPDRREHFIIKGTHNSITGCSMPTWLPADILKNMNDRFALELRDELLLFMSTTPGPSLRRVPSTDSDNLSSSAVIDPYSSDGFSD